MSLVTGEIPLAGSLGCSQNFFFFWGGGGKIHQPCLGGGPNLYWSTFTGVCFVESSIFTCVS